MVRLWRQKQTPLMNPTNKFAKVILSYRFGVKFLSDGVHCWHADNSWTESPLALPLVYNFRAKSDDKLKIVMEKVSSNPILSSAFFIPNVYSRFIPNLITYNEIRTPYTNKHWVWRFNVWLEMYLIMAILSLISSCLWSTYRLCIKTDNYQATDNSIVSSDKKCLHILNDFSVILCVYANTAHWLWRVIVH